MGFQPEIGSVSVGTLRSLKRFLCPDALAAFPAAGAAFDAVGPSWAFHKYLPLATTITQTEEVGATESSWGSRAATESVVYDHAYAYAVESEEGALFFPDDVVGWALAAAMAQHQQYCALFEGFAGRAFEWYVLLHWPFSVLTCLRCHSCKILACAAFGA